MSAPACNMLPAAQAGAQDKRGRFCEVYCAVLEARAGQVPDHRPFDDALTRLGTEPAGTGPAVPLGASGRRLVAAVVPASAPTASRSGCRCRQQRHGT